jgi:hypothetical protein
VHTGVTVAGAQPTSTHREPLTIAAGVSGGPYYGLAEALAVRLQDEGVALRVVATGGSADNLAAVRSGSADFALVQSNVLAASDVPVGTIAMVTNEPVYLVTQRALTLPTVQSIVGKRVFLGFQGSGSRLTAIEILGCAGISLHEIDEVVCQDYEEVVDRLKTRDVDVALFTFASPPAVLGDAMAAGRLRLVGLDRALIKRLLQRSPYYVSTVISAQTDDQGEAVPTVAVRTVLVAGEHVGDEEAYAVTKTLFSEWRSLAGPLGFPKRLSMRTARSGFEGAVHPGASRFYREKWYLRMIPRFDLAWAVVVAVAVILLVLVRRDRRLLRGLWHHPVLASIFALLAAWYLGALVIFAAERAVNTSFDPFPEALWSVVVFLFSGFEDRFPVTDVGRVVTVVIMLVGAGSLAVITASIAATFTKRRLEGRKMPRKLKDHYVICNSDHRIFTILRELHAMEKEKRPTVVLTERDDVRLHGRKEDDEFLEDVFSVHGNPADARALRRVNAQDASCVIVLAQDLRGTIGNGDGPGGDSQALDAASSDARAIMTLLAMKKICRDENPRAPLYVNTVVEILDPRNIPMAWEIGSLDAGSDGIPSAEPARDVAAKVAQQSDGTTVLDEDNRGLHGTGMWVQVVCAAEIRTLLLSQAARTPGLVRFYRRLMTFSEDTNEVYVVPVPEALRSREASFQDALLWIALASGKAPVLPVGIREKDGRIVTNPPGETTFEAGDDLIVISYDRPDFGDLDESLLERVMRGLA